MDADFIDDTVATTRRPALEEVLEMFAVWRVAKRSRNSPIPDALWGAALSLRGEMTLCAIGKALRLNPSHLADRARRHTDADDGAFVSDALVPATIGGGARFVEIASGPAANLASGPLLSTAVRQILEVRFPDGTTVSATHTDPVDVAPLLRALLSARR